MSWGVVAAGAATVLGGAMSSNASKDAANLSQKAHKLE